MIELKQLRIQYQMGESPLNILYIPNLKIAAGEQIALTGPSGSGKSTLLHCIGGVMEPTAGDVIVAGTAWSSLAQAKRDRFRQAQIGYIFQDFYLIPSLTAEENVQLVLPKMPKKEAKQLMNEWFQRVGLADRQRHLPSQLSRGQQQRVAIIRALIHQPSIVLADEPTGSLDYETARQVMDLLLALCQEQKQTLLCVTHDLTHPQRFTRHLQMDSINEVLQKGVKLA